MPENKDNKILNVPNLRFPEFEGEWEEHYLSDYLDFKNGLNPKPERFGKGIRFISVMDILNNAVITNDCIRASVDVSEEELLSFCVENGDILFQRSSETLEDVGRANVYMDNKPAVFGGFVIRGKKKAEYDPLFFRYLLASPFARKKIIPMGAGAQHFNIGQEGLNKVKLHFALLDEQKKIARLLSLLDERIANGANGIIGKYREYNHRTVQICITCRGNTCGMVNYTKPKSWITGNAMIVNTDDYQDKICKRYLYHYLSTYNFNSIISGSGQPQIVRSPLEKLKVKLPAILKQKQIATFLDKLQNQIEINNNILHLYLQQKQYLFRQMFI